MSNSSIWLIDRRIMKEYATIPKDWSLSIRVFNVISWTLVGRVLPLCRDAVGVFYSPSRMGFQSVELENSKQYALKIENVQ